ncbi:calmodulin-binding protein 60 B-like [Mercurialis annua]|uniref:calmodulin-binding protein 60 B-like n=1 Tax=Mercurialis annua TaxID=3986 RepID=UPI00215FC242|nr:calmodulin-binding protein 60 B-like [Mercurialis annua]XP_050216682.1 calmodulin-binding protein 60 B-like [Mercurialis annua]XP_050216683.1 calmodulin-binding protein 60 B-like [Mercurialis annua]XP_050216684.1 calmodulin-binding protein 60 B-like [Mercurialis annua]
MQTRYMERTNSMARGKRALEGEEDQPERKRPALASVIVEALKVDSLQKLCSSLEPILRRVVSEEVERALAKMAPPRLNGRASPKRIEGPDGRNLQLHFRSRLSLPLFTGGKVEGEQGAAIHIVLIDANTGHVVTSGPEAFVKLDIVVLEGDFNNEDDEGWTQEEFETHVVKEREGKRPLLTGDLQVILKEGVGSLGDLTFTDNSSWIRSRKFRMGLKVASGFCEGIRIREAKTEAFTVKDHRGELYKKHYPPALNDDVWRLEKIGKDGSFHKKLNNKGIFTVEDFLRLLVRDAQNLRNILGSGMSNKMWEALVEHAKTCALSGKLYVYYPEDSRNVGVVFNNIYELNGLISGEQYYSAGSLSDEQKVYVDTLVKKAYENWNQVVEYDGKSLMNFKQSKRSNTYRNEIQIGQLGYSHALDHQMQIPRLPASVTDEQASVHSGVHVGVYNDSMGTGFSSQPQFMNPNSRPQYDNTSFLAHEPLINNSHPTQSTRNDSSVGLALGPPQSSSSGFQALGSSMQPSNVNPFDDWTNNRDKGVDDYFNEEEIRLRSHEMLENEDMQHLLRLFSMGGHASVNMPEDGFSFPNFMASPMPNYDEGGARPGKAVVGWLKIKAAMRWGFFIRKKAAERRAQLVELDDEE